MCFVLIGCWPCGHMKPIRTRFCDQAEPLPQHPTSLPRPQQRQTNPHFRRHPHSTARSAPGTSPQSPPFPPSVPPFSTHPSHLVSKTTTEGGARAALAPCLTGVNQYEHDPHKACPVCGREPKDVQMAAAAHGDRDGDRRGRMLEGSREIVSGGASLVPSEDELAAQIFGGLGAGEGIEVMGMESGQQLVTPPAEVMMAGGLGAGAAGPLGGVGFGGDADAELFAWCLGDLPTSSCGV